MGCQDNANLKTSGTGLGVVKCFESCDLTAYLDIFKIPTIGWGHTDNVKIGDTCTQAQADAWLLADLNYAEGIVKRAVNVPLSQAQFDALVSFVYNVGPGKAGVKSGLVTLKNGKPSTLLKLINAKDFGTYNPKTFEGTGAVGELLKWTNQGVAGLVRRRRAEASLFVGG